MNWRLIHAYLRSLCWVSLKGRQFDIRTPLFGLTFAHKAPRYTHNSRWTGVVIQAIPNLPLVQGGFIYRFRYEWVKHNYSLLDEVTQ